jgi:acyl-CoA synthetase (AMP-forming)/AMP-acid ligase II
VVPSHIAWNTADKDLTIPRTKFSHSTFWPSVTKYKATIIQYVGELCRYLVNAPPGPLDRAHSVKMAWGNGMRPDVWEAFRERFNIPTIHELYAASDGMGATFNANRGEFSAHAIGVRGLLWNVLAGSREKIVEIDIDTQEIIRYGRFARECKTGEPGEVIHWIDSSNPRAQFEGYFKNEVATEKRFIRDVFKKGDMWFRSGDMMRQDAEGRVYFVDRLGDTFRWKSENVSTNEVSDLLGKFPLIAECNVYGVLVPHADGRAGCAAIVLAERVTESEFDLKALADHALRVLPRYAVPIFLRITPALGYTSTMKMQKGKLRQEGCDVAQVERAGDRMYWLPPHGVSYVPFTAEDYQRLEDGEVRL